jgi:hypothetical protein
MLPLSSTTESSTEKWATLTAIAGVIAVALKKFLGRKSAAPKPEYITRAEFHRELTAMRDRIGAGYLAVAEKMDQHHRELLASLETQITRINDLETGLARVDERTHRR